jgi:alpha-1,3/alpha-1,6-mannosyltransferase
MYTPENEHFGIVPLEAMYMGCIVFACNSGGPLESVEDGKTGYLMSPNIEDWGKKVV